MHFTNDPVHRIWRSGPGKTWISPVRFPNQSIEFHSNWWYTYPSEKSWSSSVGMIFMFCSIPICQSYIHIYIYPYIYIYIHIYAGKFIKFHGSSGSSHHQSVPWLIPRNHGWSTGKHPPGRPTNLSHKSNLGWWRCPSLVDSIYIYILMIIND